jgi:hypothetical protein
VDRGYSIRVGRHGLGRFPFRTRVFQGWIPNGTGEPVGAATGQLAKVVCVCARNIYRQRLCRGQVFQSWSACITSSCAWEIIGGCIVTDIEYAGALKPTITTIVLLYREDCLTDLHLVGSMLK